MKRVFDFAVSCVLIILVSPFILLVAIAIKLDTRGPVFFKQVRVGKDGKPFFVYKFRTLNHSSPPLHLQVEEIKDIKNFVFPAPPDGEKTRVGQFLRKMSLNEIPQLFNVVKGEMSLVGPRPEVPEIVRLYVPEYKKRLQVMPGITGLAQIEGRGDLPLKDVIALDLKYIDHHSFFIDLRILLKTLSVVYSTNGAK